jgi:V8-like Glu-specific endopeptidase
MRRLALFSGVLLGLAGPVSGDEGMWTFDEFPADQVAAKQGVRPDPKWLDHVRLSSLRYGSGCSASFVSPQSLVMTNHHCAVSCIQDLSTKENDLVATGFYAKSRADERQCPGLEVNQLLEIRDVTARVNEATQGRSDEQFTEALNAVKARITKECTGEGIRCEVVTLYSGGQYDLYKYRRYDDVRLVFAPEEASAFFGGDPDNFQFPRYNLDVSFLRVYDRGAPLASKHYFKWSKRGAEDGMPTFVTGNPGSTERELTVAQLEPLRDEDLPEYLMYLSELRGMLAQFQTKGAEQARISQTQLQQVENTLKALRGEREALADSRAFGEKIAAERAFRRQVETDPKLKAAYGGAWDAIAAAVEKERSISTPYTYIEDGRGFRSRLYTLAKTLVRAAEELPKPNEQRLPEFADAKLPALQANLFSAAPIYDELQIETLTFSLTKLREALGPDHPIVRQVLGPRSPREVAEEAVKGTKLEEVAVRKALYEGGKAAVEASDDAMIRLAKLVEPHARELRSRYEREVEGVIRRNREMLGRARFEVHGTSIYPDATFTPRISYGSVRGWVEDGRGIGPMTTLAGAFERHTGREPFALPRSWLEAKEKLNLATPFNFVTTNDVIGGNSGSPVIDADAEIVGLVFDGNIHSLGGAYWFDEDLNRTVAVHSEAIVEALDEVYGANRLLKELGR